MNFYQHSPEQINQLADALEDPDLDMNGLGWKAAFHLRELQARIAELEAMLDAVGAGGVGQSIKPQVQADTAQKPVAWRVHPFDYGVGSDGVYALTMRTEQVEVWQRKEWKVEPLYAAPQPARQPLKDDAKRLDWLMLNISGAEFRRIGIEYSGICTRKDIDNAIERENGITRGQQ